MEVVNLVGQLAVHATAFYNTRRVTCVRQVVLHHSGANAVVKDGEAYTRAIARYHVRLGWPGIGYHFTIGQDGQVYQVNELEITCWHAGTPVANSRSVGVCLLGNFVVAEPSAAQVEGARWLLQWLGMWAVPHYSIVPTACPGKAAGVTALLGRWPRGGDVTTKAPSHKGTKN